MVSRIRNRQAIESSPDVPLIPAESISLCQSEDDGNDSTLSPNMLERLQLDTIEEDPSFAQLASSTDVPSSPLSLAVQPI
jgi:hypothetical protein